MKRLFGTFFIVLSYNLLWFLSNVNKWLSVSFIIRNLGLHEFLYYFFFGIISLKVSWGRESKISQPFFLPRESQIYFQWEKMDFNSKILWNKTRAWIQRHEIESQLNHLWNYVILKCYISYLKSWRLKRLIRKLFGGLNEMISIKGTANCAVNACHSSAETTDLGSPHIVSFSHVFVSLCSSAQPNLTRLSIPFTYS